MEDPVQCDKFYECDTSGKLTEKLCPDGFVYDIPGRSCNHPQRVECEARTELQEPQVFPGCPRRNGYFNPPEPERCNEYVECVDGLATAGKCSTGVVWSPPILACTVPAQSGREECIKAEVKEYTCPPVRGALRSVLVQQYNLLTHLTAGLVTMTAMLTRRTVASSTSVWLMVHSTRPPVTRLANTFINNKTKLRTFFQPKVFSEEKGSCLEAEEVPGCEDYNKKEDEK